MKILVTIGTRPEAIKMAPLIIKLKQQPQLQIAVCNTGQHKDLLDPILEFFNIVPDYNLEIMKKNQNLSQLTSNVLVAINNVFNEYRPDYVLVHGDTTTSFATSLSAYYSNVKVGHVEAGLRTFNKLAPFPEEINRSLNGRLADIHFAPTLQSKENLLAENIKNEDIIVTGNTVIDALFESLNLIDEESVASLKLLVNGKRVILFTGHRRENFGDGFNNVFAALAKIVELYDDVCIIYPVHPNPNVNELAKRFFENESKIHLINPLNYGEFIWLMKNCYLIITDSGGIQEEAPSLGKPVLVAREVTERPEAVHAGTVILVGTDYKKIVDTTTTLLDDKEKYTQMTSIINPYGDGMASERITNYFINQHQNNA